MAEHRIAGEMYFFYLNLYKAISHANLKAALEAEQPDTDAAMWCALLLVYIDSGCLLPALLHTTACRISRIIGLSFKESVLQCPLALIFRCVCQPRVMELEG